MSLGALVLASSSHAGGPGTVVTTEHVRAELLLHAPSGIAAGRPVWLALALDHQPRWHTYWKNPGDSGLPTSLTWQLSGGATAGHIAWPTPQALPIGPLVNYGYEGRVLLPVPVSIAPGFTGGELQVSLQAEWLACKDVCVPESAEFTLKVPTRAPTATWAKRFEDALTRVPVEPAGVLARAVVERRALAIEVDGLPATMRGRPLRFFAELPGVVEHAAVIDQRWDAERWIARVPLSSQRSESPATMPAVLVSQGQPTGVRVNLAITGSWSNAALPQVPAARRVVLAPTHNATADLDKE
ncbi:MAG TPA: protein-disulfide reductase DsbD domain-containing protein [Burkholderiaceae bacterium]|nr:protein-disulfide reductase DsbD domain-containing protein [Burkholderiaceae bacterium]